MVVHLHNVYKVSKYHRNTEQQSNKKPCLCFKTAYTLFSSFEEGNWQVLYFLCYLFTIDLLSTTFFFLETLIYRKERGENEVGYADFRIWIACNSASGSCCSGWRKCVAAFTREPRKSGAVTWKMKWQMSCLLKCHSNTYHHHTMSSAKTVENRLTQESMKAQHHHEVMEWIPSSCVSDHQFTIPTFCTDWFAVCRHKWCHMSKEKLEHWRQFQKADSKTDRERRVQNWIAGQKPRWRREEEIWTEKDCRTEITTSVRTSQVC